MSAPRIYTKCPTMPQSICVGLQLCSSTATVEHAPRFGLTPNCVSLSKSSCCCMLVFQLLDWRFATQQQKICKKKKVAKIHISAEAAASAMLLATVLLYHPRNLALGISPPGERIIFQSANCDTHTVLIKSTRGENGLKVCSIKF